MAQHGEAWGIPLAAVGARRRAVWLPPLVAVAIVLFVAGVVLGLRVTNQGAEPEGENWWLVAELVLALAYLPAGVVLAARRGGARARPAVRGRRGLRPARRLVHAVPRLRDGARHDAGLAVLRLAVVVGLDVRRRRPGRPGAPRAAAGRLEARSATPGSRSARPSPPCGTGRPPRPDRRLAPGARLEPARGPTDVRLRPRGHRRLGHLGTVIVDLVATLAVAVLAWRCLQRRRASDDPLPGWLLAGAVVAWLAVVPPSVAVVAAHLPAVDVVQPMLLLATVPLLVVGALIEVVRHGIGRRRGGVAPLRRMAPARRGHRRDLHRAGGRAWAGSSGVAARPGCSSRRPVRSPCSSSRPGAGRVRRWSTGWCTARATIRWPSCAA